MPASEKQSVSDISGTYHTSSSSSPTTESSTEEKKKQKGEEERKIMMQEDKRKNETDALNKAKTDHPALPIWSICNHLRSQMAQFSVHLHGGLTLGALVPVLAFLTNEQIAQKKKRIQEHEEVFRATFATAKYSPAPIISHPAD